MCPKTQQQINKSQNLAKNIQQDGFSNDEQPQQQFIYTHSQNIDEYLQIQDSQHTRMKLQVQHIREITNKNYSLQPDMINGWVPKIQMAKPIPLTFANANLDYMIDFAFKNKKYDKSNIDKQDKILLCYMGPRYQTTYFAWYDKDIQFPYRHLDVPKKIKLTDRFLVGQHWYAEKENILQFDSLFQSGNLDCAIKVGQNQYDLFIRVDSNTRGHLQWFNFRIKNIKMGIKYKFNICNFQKGKSLYTRGMKPYCHSQKKYWNQKIGWHQIQCQVKYRKKFSKTQKILQSQQQVCRNYVLTFDFSTKYEQDQIQFAYCVPYTYSHLKLHLNKLLQQNQNQNIISVKKLCNSLGGHIIDEVTITQNIEEQQQSFKNKIRLRKKIAFITGRCHPGQTNGSWMVEGALDFLCGDSEMAIFLRHHTVFKIIPLLNPDGVILGNYRTGLFGKDFNRQFENPDKDIFPQIYSLKQMFWNYKQIYQENALIYLDFHGHSIKKNVFAYGPQYAISHKNYYEARIIPKIIAMKTQMFRYHSCIFKIAQSKQSTGRAIFLKSHKIPFTYTIEASNGSYFNRQQGIDSYFNEYKWKQVGQKVLQGIHDYIKLMIQVEKIKQIKLKQRKQLLAKARQRSKPKKIKNQKAGYLTSMGFRKSKTTLYEDKNQLNQNQFKLNQINFSLNDILSARRDIVGLQGGDTLSQLLSQIRNQKAQNNEENQNEQNKSDDQISQGLSDSQQSKDDLDEASRQQLLSFIKEKKNKSHFQNKIKIQAKTSLNNANRKVKTMYNIQSDGIYLTSNEKIQQDGEKQKVEKAKIGMQNKKFAFPKKSVEYNSLSPKRQQIIIPITAKIVNFNFSLNPVQCTLSSQNNQSNLTNLTNKSSIVGMPPQIQKKIIHPNITDKYNTNSSMTVTYNDNFKKAFIGVQKQIIKRDNYKRYVVSINNKLNKNNIKHNYVIQNFKNSFTKKNDDNQCQEQEIQKQQRDNNNETAHRKIRDSSQPFKYKQKYNISKKQSLHKISIQTKHRKQPIKEQLLINQTSQMNKNLNTQTFSHMSNKQLYQNFKIDNTEINLQKQRIIIKKNKSECGSPSRLKKYKLNKTNTFNQ